MMLLTSRSYMEKMTSLFSVLLNFTEDQSHIFPSLAQSATLHINNVLVS